MTIDTTSYLPEAKRGRVGVDDVGVVVYEARASMSYFVDPHAIGMCFCPAPLQSLLFAIYNQKFSTTYAYIDETKHGNCSG